MKKFKYIYLGIMIAIISMTMRGCVCYNNKGWSDLSDSEREKVVSALEKAKEEIKDNLCFERGECRIAYFIIDKIEEEIKFEEQTFLQNYQ